jgi:hypothetical protein
MNWRRLQVIIIITGLYAVYRYRYKIINVLLGYHLIRNLAVAISMNIPFIRNRFIHQVFRY